MTRTATSLVPPPVRPAVDAPVLVADLHLDAPLPELNNSGGHRAARLLVMLHGQPLGEVVLPLGPGPLAVSTLAGRVWPLISGQAARHYADDGLMPPSQLPPGGLPGCPAGRCPGRPALAEYPEITVVVATRDRTESLLRCLDSLAGLDYPAFDVVVADSAPRTDATRLALAGSREWPFRLDYVRVPRPGLALAHNAALTAVTGEIVAITDDDVQVGRDWLTALAEGFADPEVTCVTGLILPAELQTRAQLLVEQSGGFARGFTRRTFSARQPSPDPLFPFTAGRFGSGANMAFRTRWLAASGGFDQAAGAGTPARGGDDLIAFLRVITDGGTIVYQPRAILRHWHRREYDGMLRQAFGYGMGLGAYLTASVWAKPTLLGAMLRRGGPALRHLLGPDSAKNSGRERGFPAGLVWRERAGVLAGPFGYAVSRWRYRGSGPAAPGHAAGTGAR